MSTRSPAWLMVTGLTLSSACGGPTPAERTIETSIRLIDELATAEIDSPLLDVRGRMDGIAAGDALSSRPLWAADLGARSYRARDCRPDPEGVLRCGEETGSFRLRFELPNRGAAYTAIVLELRAPDPSCVELEVWDDAERRRLPLPGDAADWWAVPVIWPTRQDGSDISLRLSRRQLAEPCRLAVRSVAAFELAHDHALSLVLLEELRPAAGVDPDLGIAKFDAYLPLADAETVRPPFDDNFGAREALLAPTPTDLRFRTLVPERGRLLFSYALSRESRIGDRVDFEVLAAGGDGSERRLWSRRLELTDDNWHWHEAEVSLEALWGETTDLVLRTRSPSDRAIAIWGTPAIDVPRRSGDPPNVILIAVDTLRADRLSAYGYPEITSPRIDELARDGVLFRDVTSQSNWTIPSFASIFTGQIVARHRLATFMNRLGPSKTTLAQHFRRHGWRTHAILYQPALYRRLDRGFETYFNVPRENHRADQNLAKALDWLRRARDRRFFLFLHFNDPHQPFTQPEAFVGASSAAGLRRLDLELPLFLPTAIPKCPGCTADGAVTDEVKSLAHGLYDEEIRYVDSRIGLFLDELRQMGLYDDAVIAFVSDHGETLWSHYDFYGHGGANQHDELIRVPMIVKPPLGMGYRRGAVVETRVRAFDLMPTLLELAGIAPPEHDLDARSLVAALEPDASVEEDRVAFSHSSASAALVIDPWKYIMPVGRGIDPANPSKPALRGERLYDLSEDPAELNDLSTASPQVLASLRAAAIEYLLEHVGGRFVLVSGARRSDRQQRLLITCDPACGWDPLVQFGLERVGDADPRTAVFEGPGLGGEIVLLARLSTASRPRLRVYRERHAVAGGREVGERLAFGGVVPFAPGIVTRLASPAEPTVWILEAPDRVVADEVPAAEMDPQQENALRALGYLQ